MNPEKPDRDTRTNESQATLWTWVSIPTFTYVLGMWIRTQTSDFKLVSILVEDVDHARVFGLFASPFIMLSIFVAARYAWRNRGKPLPDRVPAILEKGLADDIGRRVRVAIVLGVLSVETASQVHFLRNVLGGTLYFRGEPFTVGKWNMISIFKWDSLFTNGYQFGHATGPTYFPGIETWFWIIMVSAVVAMFLMYLLRSLRILS